MPIQRTVRFRLVTLLVSFLVLPVAAVAEEAVASSSGNPAFPGQYADPEVVVFGDTYKTDRDHRVTCIDRMEFSDDGTIQPVTITFEGVQPRPIGLTPESLSGSWPNMILIIADDVSATDIGCYGNPDVRTPNLDRLVPRSSRRR